LTKVGVVSRTDAPAASPVTRRVIEHLKKRGVAVQVETETAMALDIREGNTDLTELNADWIVSVGGDGTILRVAMGLNPSDTPILGVNMGRRGFLCEVSPEEVEDAIDRVLKGDYFTEDALKLASRCRDDDQDFPDALNEVLISSSMPSKMIYARIIVDGEVITEIQADGVIVSTPTGSTAYNVSAGGSIMAPGVDAYIVTAICPYSYFRSIALPTRCKVTIELLKPRADALAIIDGKVYTAVKPMSSIDIGLSKNRTHFIRFKPFYGRLRSRLSHLQSQ
jgi:NAD+ kinase